MADEISRVLSSPHHSLVQVAGELDLLTAPLLRAVLTSADGDPAHELVVSLSGVTFMDCSGLRPLLEAHARLGDRLRLRDLPRAVTDVLRMTGLEQRFVVDGAAPPGHTRTTGRRAGGNLGSPARPGRATTAGDPAVTSTVAHRAGDHTTLEVQTTGPGPAIDRRRVIEQAVGILMAGLDCDAQQASHALSQMSWDQGSTVQDAALALIASTQRSVPAANATVHAATGSEALS